MTKTEFIAALASELNGFPQHEVQKIFEYYEELFAEGLEGGKTEEEICASLESPREIAERFRIELAFVRAEQKPTPKAINTVLLILLGLFALPVGLPLIGALFVLILSAAVVVVCLIGAAVAAVVALGGCGIGFFVIGFYWIFTGSVLSGIALIGAALIQLALGVMATIGFVYLIRAIFRWLVQLFHKIYNHISGRNKKKEQERSAYNG